MFLYMFKKSLRWTLFLSIYIHKVIKENNTSGKYIHTAITSELFFSFSKITITCRKNQFLFWVTSFQHIKMQLYQFFELHQNLTVRKLLVYTLHAYASSLIDIWTSNQKCCSYKINKVVDHDNAMSMLIYIRKQARIKTKKTKEQKNQVSC